MERHDVGILKDLMLDHIKATSAMQADIHEIKADLKHYVNKTEQLEEKTEVLTKQVHMAQGSVALFGFLAVLGSIWKSFKS